MMMHDEYFELAGNVARSATCKRAQCGSVIVSKKGRIIGKGYNAPPLNDESQRACDAAYDMSKKPKSDKTCCVHAEWNAIINALKTSPGEISGSTLYFMRVDSNGEFTDAGRSYCTVCSRLALQSGIKTFGLWSGGAQMFETKKYNLLSYDFYT